MAKHKYLSLLVKNAVVDLINNSSSYSTAGNHFGIPKMTVGGIMKHYNEKGDVARAPKSGRPCAASSRDDSMLKRLSMADLTKNAIDLNQEMRELHNVKVSVSTTKPRLSDFQLYRCHPAKKPSIVKNWTV